MTDVMDGAMTEAQLRERVRKMTPEQRRKLAQLSVPRIVDPYFVHIPHPKQQLFLSLMNREVMYGGAAGGGKSDSLLMSAAQFVDVPGYSALILRRTWPDLNAPGAILDRARSWWGGLDVRMKDGGRIFEFPSGARIQFGYIQHEADKYKFQCFTPDTDILTRRGWVPVAQVTTEDMVASVDPTTKAMSYEHVSQTYSYDCDEPLVDVFQPNGVSFRVTPNHTVWAGTERRRGLRPFRADELPLTATIPQVFEHNGAPASGKRFSTRNRGGHSFSPDEWLKFLGWYVSEGNCGSYGGRWEVKITQQKPGGWKTLLADLSSVEGFHWSDHKYVTLNNKALVEWLIKHTGTGALNKRLPVEVFDYDAASSETLLRALVAGDGSVMSNKWMRYYTYSKQLADDVMRLAVHAGWRPTLDVRDGGNYKEESITYIIHLSKRERDTGLQTAVSSPTAHWMETEYTGKVHCVTTPRFNTLIIRHRGRVSMSGNSAEYQFVGFDELTQFPENVYTYLFSRVRRPQVSCLNCQTAVRRGPDNKWYHSNRGQKCPGGIFPDPKVIEQYPPAVGSGISVFNVPLRMRSATNPGGVGHDWVRRRFVDKKTRETSSIFIPASLRDNPSLDQESYIENLQHLSPADRMRLLEGDWDVFEAGDVFDPAWFKIVQDTSNVTGDTVRFWDRAATANGGDYTVGVLMTMTKDGSYYIKDVVRGQWSSRENERIIASTAARDGVNVQIRMEQEPGSSGKDVIDHYTRNILRGYAFRPVRPTGDKVVRASPFASACEAGNVFVQAAQWTKSYVDEFALFPIGKNDDQVDATSGAFSYLTLGRRTRVLV